MSFIKLSKFFFPISLVLVLLSWVVFLYPGPKVGIEFTGGTLMELGIAGNKTQDDLARSLRAFSKASDALEETMSRTSTDTFLVRTRTLSNEEHTSLLAHLNATLGTLKELQYTTIGPTVGQSLRNRAFWALFAAIVAIILYIAIAFRKIPRSFSPWIFGLSAIVALVHDISITLGIFTVLSYVTTFQVDTLFVTALLSIMGYSVSDTIVIFDRIRDNLFEERNIHDISVIAERGLKQCMSRTLNTGLGALIMLFSLFFFGSESIRWFVLALIVGTIIGTYSSFFIATPLLVYWKKK